MKNAFLSFGIAAGIMVVLVLMGASMQAPAETAPVTVATPPPSPSPAPLQLMAVREEWPTRLEIICDRARGHLVYISTSSRGTSITVVPGGCRDQMEAAGK